MPVARGAKHELTGIVYDECIATKFQICKHPCIGDCEEISVREIRDITRWLNRKEFHKFKLIDVEYMDIYFEASFNVNKIEFCGKTYGLELEMITNRPYALHEPIYLTIRNSQENGKKSISSLSDEVGHIYPEMEIHVEQDGDLEIYNSLENRTMRIANCTQGEIIRLKYPMINTSVSSHKIQNDYNWKFFRIANTFSERVNEITISLPCTIKIKYSPIVKISI